MSTETTIADKLEDLIEAKADMKAAIESKGVTVTGGLSTYADAINSISNFKSLPINTKFGFSDFKEAPDIDTTQWTDMRKMFVGCSNLNVVPAYDTSNVTDFEYCFSLCASLETIPPIDTSKATNMSYMFSPHYLWSENGDFTIVEMNNLKSLPLLNAGNVANVTGMFGFQGYSDYLINLTDVAGFAELGKVENIRGTDAGAFLYNLPNLTKESIINIINNLYDRAANGLSIKTLRFYFDVSISADIIAVATNKGWSIVY